jgi:hypothetical protein
MSVDAGAAPPPPARQKRKKGKAKEVRAPSNPESEEARVSTLRTFY